MDRDFGWKRILIPKSGSSEQCSTKFWMRRSNKILIIKDFTVLCICTKTLYTIYTIVYDLPDFYPRKKWIEKNKLWKLIKKNYIDFFLNLSNNF